MAEHRTSSNIPEHGKNSFKKHPERKTNLKWHQKYPLIKREKESVNKFDLLKYNATFKFPMWGFHLLLLLFTAKFSLRQKFLNLGLASLTLKRKIGIT